MLRSVFLFISLIVAESAVCGDISIQPKSVFDDAVARVHQDAMYIGKFPWDVDQRRLAEFSLALSAVNLVQNSVSSTRYGYVAATSPASLPKNDEEALGRGIGICGNQVSVFLDLATRVGLKARSLEFYWNNREGVPSSHIAAEVKIGGKWAFFDITWGTYFKANLRGSGDRSFVDILSFAEVKNLKNRFAHAVTNAANLAFRLQIAKGIDPFEYIDQAKTVLVAKEGEVLLPSAILAAVGWNIVPKDLPTYIGLAPDYSTGNVGSVDLKISVPAPVTSGVLKKTSQACVGRNEIVARSNVGEATTLVPHGQSVDMAFALPPGLRAGDTLTISLRSCDKPCACTIVYKAITLK